MITVPQLYLQAKKGKNIPGNEVCFYCGASCNQDFSIKNYVKPTFTGYNTVKRPKSQYICKGCVYCFNEKSTIIMITGEIRENSKPRSYSWLITENAALAATKATLKEIMEFCLNPPKGLYAIILSESGQKQLLYRGVVNSDRNLITVTLEEEIIKYEPWGLKERLILVKKIIAGTGKPALKESLSFNHIKNLIELWGEDGEDLYMKFYNIKNDLLTSLAIWLSPGKEECKNEFRDYFKTTIQGETSGSKLRTSKNEGCGHIRDKNSDNQILFDFG